MVVTYNYKKRSANDLSLIVKRQNMKVWDYGDAIIYGSPSGKMSVYIFVDRAADSEVLEPAPIGWCPPAAPAVVYEMGVGLTKDPNIVIIGDYVRVTQAQIQTSRDMISAQQQPKKKFPKNPRHTNQGKQQRPVTAPAASPQQSIPLRNPQPEMRQDSNVRRKIQPRLQMMSIPLLV
jgi:hypothetical protein